MIGRIGRIQAVLHRGATTRHPRVSALVTGCAAATLVFTTAQTQCKSMASMRVVQYNVLSDSLDGPDHYTFCDPKDLDGETRFQRVCAKLEVEMQQGAVLCLQEVSRTWGAKLVPFFEKHGYTHTTALTGSKFGGYMGQCIAWPSNKFQAVEVETIRASDTVDSWPIPEKPAGAKEVPLTLWQRIMDEKPEQLKPEKPPFNPWAEAAKRHNAFIMARLQEKESGKQFSVVTYHMPCLFGSDAKCSVTTMRITMRMIDFAIHDPSTKLALRCSDPTLPQGNVHPLGTPVSSRSAIRQGWATHRRWRLQYEARFQPIRTGREWVSPRTATAPCAESLSLICMYVCMYAPTHGGTPYP